MKPARLLPFGILRRGHGGPLLIFLGIFIWGLNARYPLIGEDYFYVFPRLLEGKWHFLRQGIAPLRFAPHLCGGFPQYGNPQDHFYSLAQFFSFFFDLWTATQVTLLLTMIVGYMGWVRFGKDILRLSDGWSHVLALTCIANGFYFMHMLIGHLWVISLPLLSWLLWLLFIPGRENARTLWKRAILFGLLSAYMLYSGSQSLLLLLILCIAGILPFALLCTKSPRAEFLILLRRIAAYGVVALLLSASKLVAVWSLLRTLTVEAHFSSYHAGESMLLFAAKSFFAIPQTVSLFAMHSAATFSRVQEESMFLSPVILIGLLALPFFFARNRTLSRRRKAGVIFTAVILTTIILSLVRGAGIVPEIAQGLPLFSAMRVPERFLFVLSLLLSLAGVMGAAAFSRTFLKPRGETRFLIAAGLFTIIGFLAAYVPLLRNDPLSISLPYEELRALEKKQEGYLRLPVLQAFEPEGEQVSDFHYLFFASTGTQCYEALPHAFAPLRNGPVEMVYDGAFNIYHPACLQYPKENGCTPGTRVSENDRENFLRFTRGEKTTWKLSRLQVFADRLTLLSLIALPVSLFLLWQRTRRKER